MVGQECFSEALLEGARNVFETMVYMAVEECNDNYEVIEGPGILASISFKGRYEGCLGVSCSEECAGEIAANMRGTWGTDGLDSEKMTDAMGEVANMVLGAVKKLLAEVMGDVKVSIPTVVSGIELENKLGENVERVSIVVNLDESMAILTLLYRESSKQVD